MEEGLKRRGLMLVLASPPGGGKTSISRSIAMEDAATSLSVSATTREIRPGEVDGTHYYFVSQDKFSDMVEKDEFLEHVTAYNGYMYGTPKAAVERFLSAGKDVIFDIDWQGARKLSEKAPNDVVTIFILPPSWAEMETRLHGRARDTEEEIARRLSKAGEEIAHYGEFQYIIINREFKESVRKVQAILDAERLKRGRYVGLEKFVAGLKP